MAKTATEQSVGTMFNSLTSQIPSGRPTQLKEAKKEPTKSEAHQNNIKPQKGQEKKNTKASEPRELKEKTMEKPKKEPVKIKEMPQVLVKADEIKEAKSVHKSLLLKPSQVKKLNALAKSYGISFNDYLSQLIDMLPEP